MATLPETHPIHHHLARSHRIPVKRHRTPMHCLLATYRNVHPEGIETVQAVLRGPKWKPRYQTRIEGSVAEAKELIARSNAEVKIFTDGSGMKGGIGAAAILMRNGQRTRTLRYHLGPATQQT